MTRVTVALALVVSLANAEPVGMWGGWGQQALAAEDEAVISVPEAKELSRRIFDLEYPELRPPEAREIDFAGEHASGALELYRDAHARRMTGSRGGSIQSSTLAGFGACDALADYCWALYADDRDQSLHAQNAVNWSRRAVLFARQHAWASRRGYEMGRATLEITLEAQGSLLASNRKMVRAERVAAVAGVDLRGLPALEDLDKDGALLMPAQLPGPDPDSPAENRPPVTPPPNPAGPEENNPKRLPADSPPSLTQPKLLQADSPPSGTPNAPPPLPHIR